MSGRLVHLLRHGAPQVSGLLLGHTDMPLARGDWGEMPRSFHELALASLASSDLQRCRVAAEAIARSTGLSLSIDPQWRELDFGEWDGVAPGSIDPALLDRFWADPEDNPPPGGERWSQLCERVSRALSPLGDRSLVVTHGGAMRAALALVTGLDHRQVWALDLPYGALLSLRIWESGGWSGQVVGLDTGALR
ncbi:histidine phosphatase family protein [Novosphingobium sp. YJ-S2-02]|uniref:Histidine phosphatase family protein n=1 Tax=Novosphingobium aureum TaxID=2792964 RepID=A0A931HEW0_9SPHN|nr:histidine phosphatase family protein [Novosphingobium aureum]MBH0114118.1 histidine phosphatase family protein [Novosphingobium aureum]